MKPRFAAITLLALLVISSGTPAIAQTRPPWDTPADAIAVLSSGQDHGFAYAIVRDNTMRTHNVYCLTVGAHIGKLRVIAIRADGILLSNGRLLPNATVAVQH